MLTSVNSTADYEGLKMTSIHTNSQIIELKAIVVSLKIT